MSDITRSEAIKQLRLLKADITNGLSFVSKTKGKHPALESLSIAIASLETDEAYQLEYERTAGHWNEIPKYKDIAWQCSECGHFTTMKHNYCPNCGTKMVEPTGK